MRRLLIPLLTVLALMTVAMALMHARPSPARAAQQEPITLMGTLSEWRYPDADMPAGASMSDGGNPRLPSVKCQAILTTPDPDEKVIAFYRERAEGAKPDGQQPAKGAEVDSPRVICDQDDSEGRPVTVRVLTIAEPNASTTLVISRARGEDRTHIAWSRTIKLHRQR